jgi:hypothetical protein
MRYISLISFFKLKQAQNSYLIALCLACLCTQNSANYVLSYDRDQLLGNYKRTHDDATTCGRLRSVGNLMLNPCGLIANSLFNDQITLSTPGFYLNTKGAFLVVIFPLLLLFER